MRELDGITDSADVSLRKLGDMVKDREVMQFTGSQRVRNDGATKSTWEKHPPVL